jgi:diguanylate cyclase (GGDEF)-like protein
METPVIDTPPGAFELSCERVVTYLREHVGLRYWSVTRYDGDFQVPLVTRDDAGYDLESWRWEDSICVRMVSDVGNDKVVADVASHAEYAGAPVRSSVDVGAYVGMPLRLGQGELFGTLCGLDPTPQGVELRQHLPTLELVSQLLATLLQYELAAEQQQRLLARVRSEALTDQLTGVYNRRGWERLVEAEERRAERYGDPMAVIYVDLDDFKAVNDTHGHEAGDRVLVRAARVLLDTARAEDVVARLGGDEFAVLAINCTSEAATALRERIEQSLADADVQASVGVGQRAPGGTIAEAMAAGDEDMYLRKSAGRS